MKRPVTLAVALLFFGAAPASAEAGPGAYRATIAHDDPLLYRSLTDGSLPPEASPGEPPAGQRAWGRVIVEPVASPGARLTVSVRVRAAYGRVVAWPAAAPWLELTAGAGRLEARFGSDRLSAPLGDGWHTVAVVADGPAGRLTLAVDGRIVERRARAPFTPPDGRDLVLGPMVGDRAAVALFPAALDPGRLLDHVLVVDGHRPPRARPVFSVRVARPHARHGFGCPRFSPDGRWLAGCRSSLLMLTDVAAGELARVMFGHLDPIADLDVDPAGRFVITAGTDGRAILWSVATGDRVAVIRSERPVIGARFSPDGRWLATWSGRHPGAPREPVAAVLEIWSMRDYAAPPRTHPLPSAIHRVTWRPAGPAELVVTLDDDPPRRLRPDGPPRPMAGAPATAALWVGDDLVLGDARGGVRRIDAAGTSHSIREARKNRRDAATPADWPTFFDHGPDGRRGTEWAGWQTMGGPRWRAPNAGHGITALAADHHRLAVADPTGIVIRPWAGGAPTTVPHPASVTAMRWVDGVLLTGDAAGVVRRFAPDGRPLGQTVVAEGQAIRTLVASPDGGTVAASVLADWRTRQMPTARHRPETAPPPGTAPLTAVALSPDGRQILTRRSTGGLTLWDLDRVRPVRGFDAPAPATTVIWTAAGPVSGHTDGALVVWNPTTGRPTKRLEAAHSPGFGGPPAVSGGVDGLFALPDGSWVSAGRATVRRWTGAEPTATWALPMPALQVTPPALTDDGRVVVATVTAVVIVDPRTGDIETLARSGPAGAAIFRLAAGGGHVAATHMGPDGPHLVIWGPDGAITHEGALGVRKQVQRLVFGPDGTLAVVSSDSDAGDRPDQAYTVALMRPDGTPSAVLADHRFAVSAVRFDGADGVTTGAYDGYLRTFRDGRLVERQPGCAATAFAAAGAHRVTLCSDRVVVHQGDGRLELVEDADDRWLMVADDGHFAGSAEGDALATAVLGPAVLDLDRIAVARNRPDLIAHRFGLGDPALRADLEARVARRRARHGLSSDAGAFDVHDAPRVVLTGLERDGAEAIVRGRASAGARQWRIHADGVPVAEGPLGADRTFEARVPLIAGANRIEAAARDDAGVWSARAVGRVEYEDDSAPTLWVVAYGVSNYADPAITDLRFAHQDALDLVARMRGAPGWSRVVARAFTESEVDADALDAGAALVADAAPGDTVIVFVSGHGLYDAGGTYRYLTHDARLADPAGTAPAFDRIEALLATTPARRRLLLIDTCQSGERLGPPPTGGLSPRLLGPGARVIRPVSAAPAPPPMDRRDRLIDRDLRRRQGVVVLSSSRDAEASWERAELANGVFTEAVLEALDGRGDADGDGDLTVAELTHYVTRSVATVTSGRQNPTLDRENRLVRIRIPSHESQKPASD